jgi:hypothetical protein
VRTDERARASSLAQDGSRLRSLRPALVPACGPDAERRASRLSRPGGLAPTEAVVPDTRSATPPAARDRAGLYLCLRDFFSLKVDWVLYDLISTYFEAEGPVPLAPHGHSRDGEPRDRRVLVGVVMVDGWPITHHVFAGNGRDATTVPQLMEDLEQRFRLRRVVFLGDRGMVTSDDVALLRPRQQGYIVGLNRPRREDVYRAIEQATGAWTESTRDHGPSQKTPSPCAFR